MERAEILEKIRKIVGGKTFTFSYAFIKHCQGTPSVGDDGREYWGVTKKYLYINCWGVRSHNDKTNENSWLYKRYPIFYQYGSGQNIKKVPLEEMFTEDLQKVLGDLSFYIWWEGCVRFSKVAHEYQECLKARDKYNKLRNEIGYEPNVNEEEMLMCSS